MHSKRATDDNPFYRMKLCGPEPKLLAKNRDQVINSGRIAHIVMLCSPVPKGRRNSSPFVLCFTQRSPLQMAAGDLIGSREV